MMFVEYIGSVPTGCLKACAKGGSLETCAGGLRPWVVAFPLRRFDSGQSHCFPGAALCGHLMSCSVVFRALSPDCWRLRPFVVVVSGVGGLLWVVSRVSGGPSPVVVPVKDPLHYSAVITPLSLRSS